jgi:hypothetical protein
MSIHSARAGASPGRGASEAANSRQMVSRFEHKVTFVGHKMKFVGNKVRFRKLKMREGVTGSTHEALMLLACAIIAHRYLKS